MGALLERDFSKFGGWLKFFSVLFWINIVLCFLAIPAEVYIRLSGNPDIAHLADGVGLIESIVIGIVYWFVIQNIKIQKS